MPQGLLRLTFYPWYLPSIVNPFQFPESFASSSTPASTNTRTHEQRSIYLWSIYLVLFHLLLFLIYSLAFCPL